MLGKTKEGWRSVHYGLSVINLRKDTAEVQEETGVGNELKRATAEG